VNEADPRTWFWEHCANLESQARDRLDDLDRELLEFREFEARLMGEGCGAYYIDSMDIQPSLVAKLLSRFAPPAISALARDLSLVHPDDMPPDIKEREVYLVRRYETVDSLGLALETDLFAKDPFETLDNYVAENLAEVFMALRRLRYGNA
jgi:hypothetical protein